MTPSALPLGQAGSQEVVPVHDPEPVVGGVPALLRVAGPAAGQLGVPGVLGARGEVGAVPGDGALRGCGVKVACVERHHHVLRARPHSHRQGGRENMTCIDTGQQPQYKKQIDIKNRKQINLLIEGL